MGPGAGAGPGAQGAHHWGSPAPDRQWPGTNAPAVIQPGDGRPGADTTLSWSHDGGRTGKKTNVSFNKTQFRKVYISNTGRGNGATGDHRAFSDGYRGESIERSLMNPKRGRKSTKCTTECAAGTLHACFAIASRNIVGVLAKQSVSASTNNQCQLHQNNQCHLQQMRNTASNCALASIQSIP